MLNSARSAAPKTSLRVCIATSTRADYGILRFLIRDMLQDPYFSVSLLVTGTHLSHQHGYTITEIEEDGVSIDHTVDILLASDSKAAQAKSMGLALIGFTDALGAAAVDCIIILGDRFEMQALASCALVLEVPVIHLHGGEASFGVADDAFRHSITKMSWLHFVATHAYRQRVIQLGEAPERVFNVGALGVQNIEQIQYIPRQELFTQLELAPAREIILITYHPASSSAADVRRSMEQLLNALSDYSEYSLVFTMPNADANNQVIRQCIQNFSATNQHAHSFDSLGQRRYFSLLQYTRLVIGNSSSGIIEVPSFNIPSINIGERQLGRVSADSVIHCQADTIKIRQSIDKSLSKNFMEHCQQIVNPYAGVATRQQIMSTLKQQCFKRSIKIFYDIN